jgi:hypothetical protein
MATIDIEEQCNTIEACYEFTLSYAAQGLPTDGDSPSGKQLRDHLARALEAMRGLEASCEAYIQQVVSEQADKYRAYFAVLVKDAASSAAAVDLVLAQPGISSQLIDNLNASMHLRALLTDLFLVTEIFDLRRMTASPVGSN